MNHHPDEPDRRPPTSGRRTTTRCPACGCRCDAHPDHATGEPVLLLPGDFHVWMLSDTVAAHLSSGLVYPGADPTERGWGRLRHNAVCPAGDPPSHASLHSLWLALGMARARRERLRPAGPNGGETR